MQAPSVCLYIFILHVYYVYYNSNSKNMQFIKVYNIYIV